MKGENSMAARHHVTDRLRAADPQAAKSDER